MSHIVPFVVLAALIVGWAWWQSRGHPAWWPTDLRLIPEYQRITANIAAMAETIGRVMVPALQRVTEQTARLADALDREET